jgi:Dimerisation domain
MAKETILNRGGSSAIDCILPFAWNCAIGVSTQYFEIFMANNEQPQVTPERLMQFGFAYAPPLIIGAAVSNKVFDTLTRDPKSVDEVSRETGASIRGLRAIMNALVSLELLSKPNGKYTLTPESENFLVSNKPGSLGGFFSMNRLRLIELWMKLDEIVRTGQPAEARNLKGPGTEFITELVENIIPMGYGAAQALANHLKSPTPKIRCACLIPLPAPEFGELPSPKNRREWR